MRISYLITLTACTFSVFFLLGCSENSKKATDAGKSFLTNMYTCNFKECDALCTEKGKEEVYLFASNLTEDDLALISKNIEIEAEDCDITDHSASVTYTAKNVIVCDSLEAKGHLGERTLTVKLKNVNGSWKVDELEW